MDCSFLGDCTPREKELLELLRSDRMPRHIAIIMDGNGRWARRQSKARLFGHQSGRHTVRLVVEAARCLGLSCLTLYAFSTENWTRPKVEVAGLMKLLGRTIVDELPELHRNGIRVVHVGELKPLPSAVTRALENAQETTKHNEGMTLALAINYGGRRELMLAAARAARDAIDGTIEPDALLDEAVFARYLQMGELPEPDLLIRTAGEQRISNFLLWGIAYAELHFTDVLWPEFEREHLLEAIVDFQSRERRFGGT